MCITMYSCVLPSIHVYYRVFICTTEYLSVLLLIHVHYHVFICITMYSCVLPPLIWLRLSPHVQRHNQTLAGSEEFPLTRSNDLLLVRYAPTSPLCAVLINQISIREKCLMFVSPRHSCLFTPNLQSLRDSSGSGRR